MRTTDDDQQSAEPSTSSAGLEHALFGGSRHDVWPPRDASLLWRLSSEYSDLFGTEPSAEETAPRGTWHQGAILFMWICGLLVLAAACLETVVLTTVVDLTLLVVLRIVITLLLGTALLIAIWVGQKYAAARNAFFLRVRWLKANEVENALAALNDGLTLEALFTLNRRQLDEYHVMSVRQAATSFRNATVTALVGFVVLVVGAVVAMQEGSDPRRYTAAGLAGLGAVLTTYISRNFLASWRATREQLREYYVEPARTSKLLGLERLATQRGDSQSDPSIPEDLRQLIVRTLLDEFVSEAVADRAHRLAGDGRGPARRAQHGSSDNASSDNAPSDHTAPA